MRVLSKTYPPRGNFPLAMPTRSPVLTAIRQSKKTPHFSEVDSLIKQAKFFEAAQVAKTHLEGISSHTPEAKDPAMMLALKARGYTLLLIGKPKEALHYLEKAFCQADAFFKHEHLEFGHIQTLMARAYLYTDDLHKAEHFAQQALGFFDQVRPLPIESAEANDVMAHVCILRRDASNALKFLQVSRRILDSFGNGAWENLRYTYLTTSDFALLENTPENLTHAIRQGIIKLDEVGDTNPCLAARLLTNAGIAHTLQQNFKEAETSFRRALKVLERHFSKNHADSLRILDQLSRLFILSGQYAEAEVVALDLLEVAKARFPEVSSYLANAYRVLSDIYSLQSRGSEAKELENKAFALWAKVRTNKVQALEWHVKANFAEFEAVGRREFPGVEFFRIFFVPQSAMKKNGIEIKNAEPYFEALLGKFLHPDFEPGLTAVIPIEGQGCVVVYTKLPVMIGEEKIVGFKARLKTIGESFFQHEICTRRQARTLVANFLDIYPATDDPFFIDHQKVYWEDTPQGEVAFVYFSGNNLKLNQVAFPTQTHALEMLQAQSKNFTDLYAASLEKSLRENGVNAALSIQCCGHLVGSEDIGEGDATTLMGVILAFQWGKSEAISTEEINQRANRYLEVITDADRL